MTDKRSDASAHKEGEGMGEGRRREGTPGRQSINKRRLKSRSIYYFGDNARLPVRLKSPSPIEPARRGVQVNI